MRDVRLVASRYAHALADAVSDDQALGQVSAGVRALADLVDQSDELRRALVNPVISSESKGRAVDAIAERLGEGEPTRRFLAVVARHDRLVLLREMADAIATIHDARVGVHEIEICSAVPLDDALCDRLGQALQGAGGGTVRIARRVDPGLLGGIVARVGTRVFDGSIRTRLRKMRARMLGEAS